MEFEKWTTKKLGEVVNLKRGYDLPLSKREDGAVPILSSSGISDFHNEYKVKGPGVTTGRSGLLGKVYYVEDDFWPLNTSLYVEDFKGNDPKFVYYLLQTMVLENYNAGSSVPTLNRNHVHLIDVNIPAKSTQVEIGKLLYNFERKIENNNRIISNLERLSQTIFKHWFVDFEFPNEDGESYKSSGGEMIENEEGEIPYGWKFVKLNSITSHAKVAFNPAKEKVTQAAHFSIPAYDKQEYPFFEMTDSIKSNKYFINEHSLLFSKMNPDTPRIWLPNIIENKKNICSSEFIVLDTSLKSNKSFVYSLVKSEQFTNFLINNATGSTGSRQRVIPTTAMSYSFPYNESVSIKFEELVKPFHNKILFLREEIQYLMSLRDTLLPKLFSGEIELSEETEVTEHVPIP